MCFNCVITKKKEKEKCVTERDQWGWKIASQCEKFQYTASPSRAPKSLARLVRSDGVRFLVRRKTFHSGMTKHVGIVFFFTSLFFSFLLIHSFFLSIKLPFTRGLSHCPDTPNTSARIFHVPPPPLYRRRLTGFPCPRASRLYNIFDPTTFFHHVDKLFIFTFFPQSSVLTASFYAGASPSPPPSTPSPVLPPPYDWSLFRLFRYSRFCRRRNQPPTSDFPRHSARVICSHYSRLVLGLGSPINAKWPSIPTRCCSFAATLRKGSRWGLVCERVGDGYQWGNDSYLYETPSARTVFELYRDYKRKSVKISEGGLTFLTSLWTAGTLLSSCLWYSWKTVPNFFFHCSKPWTKRNDLISLPKKYIIPFNIIQRNIFSNHQLERMSYLQ